MARKTTRKTIRAETEKAGRDQINEHLHDALDGLRKDVTRVEIWATALGSFCQPVPDYSPSKKFELTQDSDTAGATKDGAPVAEKTDLKRG